MYSCFLLFLWYLSRFLCSFYISCCSLSLSVSCLTFVARKSFKLNENNNVACCCQINVLSKKVAKMFPFSNKIHSYHFFVLMKSSFMKVFCIFVFLKWPCDYCMYVCICVRYGDFLLTFCYYFLFLKMWNLFFFFVNLLSGL